MKITAKELAEKLGGTIEGDASVMVDHPAKIEEANQGAVSFIANPKYAHYATSTKASVLIVSQTFTKPPELSATLIRVDDPYTAITQAMEFYQQSNTGNRKRGIADNASIHESAVIAEDAWVGFFSVIESGASIGSGTQIHPMVYIGADVIIGANTLIYPGVQIYHSCSVGDNVVIHAGTVIGSDGFGFAPQPDGSFKKVPQSGKVIIGNDVEIGANCTLDRGSLGTTIIGDGVKLDNQVQIAHNVEIGDHTVIAAQTGVSGSTKLGKYCMVGGQAGFVGHVTIADKTRVNAKSGVSKSISEPGTSISGAPAEDYRAHYKSLALLRQLPDLEKRIRQLEKELDEVRNP